MTIDLLKLLAVLAGFAMIAAGTFLAFRQSTITWQHVIIFCLGGVLAGISGVQLQAGKDNWSVSIGELASAAQKTSDAAAQQAAAIAQLNGRVDKLQAAIEALHPETGAPAPQVTIKQILAPAGQQGLAVSRYLRASGILSQSAAMNSKSVLARLPHH